jgi:hypothetical protein
VSQKIGFVLLGRLPTLPGEFEDLLQKPQIESRRGPYIVKTVLLGIALEPAAGEGMGLGIVACRQQGVALPYPIVALGFLPLPLGSAFYLLGVHLREDLPMPFHTALLVLPSGSAGTRVVAANGPKDHIVLHGALGLDPEVDIPPLEELLLGDSSLAGQLLRISSFEELQHRVKGDLRRGVSVLGHDLLPETAPSSGGRIWKMSS